MKTCKACNANLPVSEFHRDSHYRDNLKSSCKKCVNARSRDWNAKNLERANANKRAWEAKNPNRVAAYNRKYRHENVEKMTAKYAEWVAKNPEKKEACRARWRERNRESYLEACSRAGRNWREANPEKVTAKTARRRAQLRRATVEWADKSAIESFYREAKRLTEETGVEHQVDHIIPLQSKFVCGLHNEFNLQAIFAEENGRRIGRERD